MSDPALKTPVVTLCGTYTVDPAAEALDGWLDFLGLDARTVIAPYNQLFQQLLDPGSTFRSNRHGANVVLLRWTDLLAGAVQRDAALQWGDVEPRVDEVASALHGFAHQVPCRVLVGPSDPQLPLLARATARLETMLAATPGLTIERGEALMQRYRVERVHDAAAERFGHVPFTAQAMVVLGTGIARWYASLVRPPVKVLAVDGDHTLWEGVVAEDGVDALRVGNGHEALQRALLDQCERGRLLCLLSKNEEVDVRSVFESRREMPLQWSNFVAARVDWQPKHENMRQLVTGLGLGMDSVVFLDDNPMECATMRAHCPSVMTVQVPADTARLAAFVDHLWLLDQPGTTSEDRDRTRMYAQELSRNELRQSTGSLQAFLDGLELVVGIDAPTAADLPRLAQLTQRTNQFNASLIRCNEQEVVADPGQSGAFHRSVRARDRFGDYGTVGQLRARAVGARLEVDLFLLSCRALGRGIEHRMIAAAGAHALAQGLDEVAVLFRRGERNAPVAGFLEATFGAGDAAVDSGDRWFRLPACAAAGVAFHASDAGDGAVDASDPHGASIPAQVAGHTDKAPAASGDIGERYERIAHSMTTGAQIEQAFASRMRHRADLTTGYVAPAPGLERDIASIWQQVLRVDRVGSRDRFNDLGGKSMHLVQVHSLLVDRLGETLDITTLFQHPTVASLAAHLAARAEGNGAEAGRQRGMKMRAARERAANRVGSAS